MIPQEVADIAEIMAEQFNNEYPGDDYTSDEFITVAYRIYDYMQKRKD